VLIFIDENIPQGREAFSAYGEVRTFHGRELKQADLKQADALLIRSITKVNAGLLDGTPVRFVGTATIGVDHVDQEHLRNAGIGFAAAPGCNARSVAEYFTAALLHLRVHRGLSLEGKTVGIIGYGNVGKQIARVAPQLGLKVLLCDPPLQQAGESGTFLSMKDLIAQSDILTTHVPLTKTGAHATLKMLNREALERFAGPKVFMNTSRGEVADGDALLWALANNKLSHLVLDVFPGEPHIDPKLADSADLISPHIAGYSIQGKLNGTAQILDAFLDHFKLEKKSAVKMPVPPQPVIAWPRGVDCETGMHHCVKHCYDILHDDIGLRRSLNDPELAKHFDHLRKTYPVRHQFAGFSVTGIPREENMARHRLRGLGFTVE
jgi:erythronate-4-phosphate dehydrogenase